MKRKMLSALLCATIAASMLLTGCGNGNGGNSTQDNAQTEETNKPEETSENQNSD